MKEGVDALKRTQIHWKLRIVTLTQRFTQRRGGVRGSETAPENPNPLEAWDLGLIQRFAQRRGGGGAGQAGLGGLVWGGDQEVGNRGNLSLYRNL